MTTFLSAGIILATGWVELVLTAVAVIIAIVLHEVAHGYVALLNGDATAKVNGRLSLNPIRHFDPVGFIMLLVCGFGYAKPVPVNPYNFRHRKRGIFTVAAAGVTANFLLAFISSGFMVLMNILFVRSGAAVFSGLYTFFYLFMLINLSLVFFNLLPICPLDGFRIVEAFTRYNNPVTRFLRDYGAYILIALVGLGILVDIFNMPYYFDILGTYIVYARHAVVRLFMLIWGVG